MRNDPDQEYICKEVILKRPLMAEYILFMSADFFNISKDEIVNIKNRKGKYRQKMIIKIMYDEMGFRYKEIACFLGYKPTSEHTIRWHCADITEDIDNNIDIKKTYKQLLNHLKLN
jgi:hypothetical protein